VRSLLQRQKGKVSVAARNRPAEDIAPRGGAVLNGTVPIARA